MPKNKYLLSIQTAKFWVRSLQAPEAEAIATRAPPPYLKSIRVELSAAHRYLAGIEALAATDA